MWGRALRAAEDRLRARGLTGAQAFDALLPALEALTAGRVPDDPELAAVLGRPPDVDGVLGLAYERLLPDVYKASRGQFFTPPPLARLLWSRLPPPAPALSVLDPTCGAGGLLAPGVGAALRGVEIDPRLARLCAVHLRAVGAQATVTCGDVFQLHPEPADIVVANPPFSVPLADPELVRRHRAFAGPRGVPSDVVFLASLREWLVPGGLAAVVVPWSVLANPSTQALRDALVAAFEVDAVVALPEGVFRPFGGAAGRAAVVWLRRRRRPGRALAPQFRAITDPGWDVRSLRLKPTTSAEVADAVAGRGFTQLRGRFVPLTAALGPPLHELASLRAERGRHPHTADLSDADPLSGDLHPRERAPARRLPTVRPGDLAFSRLRPELGVVALHAGELPVTGSGEWIVLRPRAHPRWLRHALRTPAFVRGLPTTGQTRPRAAAGDVLGACVPAPAPAVRAVVDEVSGELAAAHRRAAAALRALQAAVDAHAEGALDDDGLQAAALRLREPT